MTRPAHAPTAPCTSCRERPGFLEVSPAGVASYECAPCRTFRAQCGAAQQQLSDAVAPIVGMWAAQWTRAGLPLDELAALTEIITGEWMQLDLCAAERRRTLRALAVTYRHAAQEEEAPPARVQVRAADMLHVSRLMFDQTAPASLQDRPYFFDASDRQVHMWASTEATALTLPDGRHAVIYSKYPADSFTCPPELWPDVARALGFELPGSVEA